MGQPHRVAVYIVRDFVLSVSGYFLFRGRAPHFMHFGCAGIFQCCFWEACHRLVFTFSGGLSARDIY